jgi:phage-related protein
MHNINAAANSSSPRRVEFIGSSKDDLVAMPLPVRRRMGFELMRVQFGGTPANFKAMPTVGPGVFEIRVKDASGAFRLMYVAKFTSAIFVLHAFQKKTQKTLKSDIDLARARYSIIRSRS